MFKYQKSAVTSLEVFQVFCPQSKPTYVKGRSFHSLTYRQKGTVTLDTDECSISSGHGHITYVPKGMPYTTTVLEDSSIIAIHFEMDEDTFSKYMKYHLYICERADMVGTTNHILDIFRKE